MRLVVDTNVLISAALKESSWPGAVVRWLEANGGLLKTVDTEQEVFAVLHRPRLAAVIPSAYTTRLASIFAAAEVVAIREAITACRDPKDDVFLALAVNGRADAIVSGDMDLLVLGTFRDIPIVTPAGFVRGQMPPPG